MMNTLYSPFNYEAFESFFRGPLNEIKQRLSVYLPLANLLPIESSAYALDLGCGRGEWLELLNENRIPALGIDYNPKFVEHCRTNGLTVEEADLFSFVDREHEICYSLITGFHLIEHIPPERHTSFFEAVFDMLAPGGIFILETPNPENVTVGSCNFFIDPTHLRPVPPHLLQFLAIQTGFASPLIARVNRNTVGEPLSMMAGETPEAALYNRLVDIISSRLLQAPDYALIAFKPPAPSLAMLEAVSAINRLNDSYLLPPAAAKLPEPSLNTIEKTADDKVHPIPLNEYTEMVNRTYLQLLASRVITKNKTS